MGGSIGLLTMLREGHHDVQLTGAELWTFACWLDLLVPYCGDYEEANAWSEHEKALYGGRRRQRQQVQAEERESMAFRRSLP